MEEKERREDWEDWGGREKEGDKREGSEFWVSW